MNILCLKNINILNLNRRNQISIQNKPENISFKKSEITDIFEKQTFYDWQEFIPYFKEYKTKENELGYGDEAVVYALNDKYVLRTSVRKEDENFIPVEDVFEGKNFGQPIAMSSDHLSSINKRVYGKIIYKFLDFDEKNYLDLLRKYADLPNETLEEFVKDVAFIDSKGYHIDKYNTENFLYNEEAKRIEIVDLGKKDESSYFNSPPYSHEWILYPLVNGRYVLDFYSKLNTEEKDEMYSLITKIEDRIMPLCKKYDIPIADINAKRYDKNPLIQYLRMYRNN